MCFKEHNQESKIQSTKLEKKYLLSLISKGLLCRIYKYKIYTYVQNVLIYTIKTKKKTQFKNVLRTLIQFSIRYTKNKKHMEKVIREIQ